MLTRSLTDKASELVIRKFTEVAVKRSRSISKVEDYGIDVIASVEIIDYLNGIPIAALIVNGFV